jgi:protein-L-isoaspartate O-methyltransferase
MIKETVARDEARRIYDRLGAGLDRAAHFEGWAKSLALALLAVEADQRVLHVGVGTGVEHAAL